MAKPNEQEIKLVEALEREMANVPLDRRHNQLWVEMVVGLLAEYREALLKEWSKKHKP